MSKTVERTLDFLELFADQKRPLSLSDISRMLKIPASSCHDVLQTLQGRGYIYELAPRAGYYPTRRLFDLARTITDHDPVAQRADLLLRSMRDALDESVLLAKVSGLQATYLLTFEPSHPLRFLANVGDNVRSLYATSGGKALLSSLRAREFDGWLESTTLKASTKNTITSKTALRKDIETGRSRGWFLNRGESLDGVVTLSSLVRMEWGNVHRHDRGTNLSNRNSPGVDGGIAGRCLPALRLKVA
jgi:DNA-binding IclR family transcriptional regulator